MAGKRFLLLVVVAAVGVFGLLYVAGVGRAPAPPPDDPQITASNVGERHLPPLPAELQGVPVGKKPVWILLETKRQPGTGQMRAVLEKLQRERGEHMSVVRFDGDDPKHAKLLEDHLITHLPACVIYGTDGCVAGMFERTMTASQATAALVKAEEAGCSGCQHEHHPPSRPPQPRSAKGDKLS